MNPLNPRNAALRTRRSLRLLAGIVLVLGTFAAPARAEEPITFRWREAVRCGPDGTLRFDSNARLDLIDPRSGIFEFRGEAKEEARRGEEYALTLTFIDWDDRVLFRIASEPFEMDSNRRTEFLVSGRESAIGQYWDDIASVELDAQVPFEPLFEDALDFYGGVLRYRQEQDLEGRLFR